MQNITIVGSGWETVGFLKNINTKNKHITIISPDESFTYTPLLAYGIYTDIDLSYDITKIYLNTKSSKGIPVNNNMTIGTYSNAFAIGDCANGTPFVPKTAQVAYQQGQFVANKFNGTLKKKNFAYDHKGSIIYAGKGCSILELGTFRTGGRLVGYMNNFIHIYNAATYNQRMKIAKGVFF